ERAMSRHGVGPRLKGSKASHATLRDYYSAVASQEVHMHLEQLTLSDPPTKGLFESGGSHREKIEAWKKAEQKRIRDELRPLQSLAARGRLYDAERLTAQSARADATAARSNFYQVAQRFSEALEELTLTKEEVARLRTLPIKDVAAAIGYDGPIGPKENAIDLVKRVGGLDFKGATAWLHQNMGEDAMAAALRAYGAAKTPQEAIWTKADRVKRQVIERQLGALDAETYRITLMRDGSGVNFGKKELGKDLLGRDDVIASVPKLSAWNAAGWNVFVTPIDMVTRHILIDDLTDGRLAEIEGHGYCPCVVQRTSPDSIQAVLKVPRASTPEEAANEFFKDMNRTRGDEKITALERPFRLAGFQNRKEKHRDAATGTYPFVALLDAVNVTCHRSIEVIKAYAKKLASEMTRSPRRRP
ncbi:DNA-primase RepB domain-containing protein, partial [Aminobacter sp. J41]|uniref:DNA-primase RepB domain-containing protein n=1 Tax=Aminobacter sp. J41 TaxID=935261 RepID=UPI000467443E